MWTFDEWFAQNPEMFPDGTTYEETQEIRAAWFAAGQGNPDQVMDKYTFETRLAATMEYMDAGEVAAGEGQAREGREGEGERGRESDEDLLDDTTAEGVGRRERRLRKRMVAEAVLQTQESKAIEAAVLKVRREEQDKQREHRERLEKEDAEREEAVRKALEEDEKAHPDETAAERDARRNREAAKRNRERRGRQGRGEERVQPGDTQRDTVGMSQDEQERERQEQAGLRGQADISRAGAPNAHPASDPSNQQRPPGGGAPA